jgi:hypothetical protein
MMDKPTISSLDRRLTKLETETSIQFKELFVRLKRIEGLLIGTASAIILLLSTMLWKL